MALAKRPVAHPGGLDKRHDGVHPSGPWQSASRMRPAAFFRKRRFLLVLMVLVVVYLFIKHLPTDVPSVGKRIDSRTGLSQGRPFPVELGSPTNPHADDAVTSGQVYDGPVKFYHLAASLRPHLYGKEEGKENVVFVLYDLQSAASIFSVACGMALYNITNVHIGLVTMRDVKVTDIMAVNGIEQEDCPVFWHDARPDHNSQSSPARQEMVIKSALTHMHTTLKYSVVMIDQHQSRIPRLEAAIRAKLDAIRIPLTVLPNDAGSSMSWIMSLDGKALALLNLNQIDIAIMPYKQSAGSLVRLLESIRRAHYAGLPLPRITVDLPHNIDPFARRYLELFRWPIDGATGQSKLILRRHLDPDVQSPASASLRTMESFYPPTFPMSHVLVLSPDVELSPNYLQYLYFMTLQYKYSGASQRITGSLMGISLDLPTILPDGKSPFVADSLPSSNPLLLHQTPASTAALYFGDKWVELQDYLSLCLRHDPTLSAKIKRDPDFTHEYPSWLRQASELMQARNYFMLYPHFATTPDTRLAVVHTELSQHPEEFWTEPEPLPMHTIPKLDENTILFAEQGSAAIHANMEHEHGRSSMSITRLLGLKDLTLPPAGSELPMLSASGRIMTEDDARLASKAYIDQLSLERGGCAELSDRDDRKTRKLEYIFCDS